MAWFDKFFHREDDPQPHGPTAGVATRTIGEHTLVQLRLVIALLVPIAGSAFTFGTFMAGDAGNGAEAADARIASLTRDLGLRDQQIKAYTERAKTIAEILIPSLDVPDDVVRQMVESFSSAVLPPDVGRLYNQRGLNIYRAERDVSAKWDNKFRRAEVRRALTWFVEAGRQNPSYAWPHYNAAAMQALLGNADQMLVTLNAALEHATRDDQKNIQSRVCSTDTDFCAVAGQPEFIDFQRSLGCLARDAEPGPRNCPVPAPGVR